MKPARWQEIERLCHAALEMEPGKPEACLKGAYAGDESLRKEVEALLANQSEAEGFMKDPATEAAAKVLAVEYLVTDGGYARKNETGIAWRT